MPRGMRCLAGRRPGPRTSRSPETFAPHARQNSVVSLYTDEDAVESDDSLAKNGRRFARMLGRSARRRGVFGREAETAPSRDASAAADPAEDSDIDEDWGMESDRERATRVGVRFARES